MPQLFKNDARARLASGIGSADTSIVLEAGSGELFPVANMGTGTTGDWFKCTLEKATGEREIVKVRTRTSGSDILANVQRAQEGSTALTFDAGTVIGHRLTAGDVLDSFAVALQAQTDLSAHALLNKTRPIQDWDSAYGASPGYPQYAMVVHSGFTWRSKVSSNTATPGSDETKWERWGFSNSERVYGATVACGATGPTGSDDKSKIYKSTTYGELWQWLGDEWVVVGKRFFSGVSIGSGFVNSPVTWTTIYNVTPHRPGKIQVNVSFFGLITTTPTSIGCAIVNSGQGPMENAAIASSPENSIHATVSGTMNASTGQPISIRYYLGNGITSPQMQITWQYVD